MRPFEEGGVYCFVFVTGLICPTPCATDNSRRLCSRYLKLGKEIILDDQMIPYDIQVSRSRSKVKPILIGWGSGQKCFTNISFLTLFPYKLQMLTQGRQNFSELFRTMKELFHQEPQLHTSCNTNHSVTDKIVLNIFS